MTITCDCSTDEGDSADIYEAHVRTSRKRRKCCECHEVIEPGQRYERADSLYDGSWGHSDTCMPCLAIRERYCPRAWVSGELVQTIDYCLGFDYRKVPA